MVCVSVPFIFIQSSVCDMWKAIFGKREGRVITYIFWLGEGEGSYRLHSSKSILNLTCFSELLFSSRIPSNDFFGSPTQKPTVNIEINDIWSRGGNTYHQHLIVFWRTVGFCSWPTCLTDKSRFRRRRQPTNPTESLLSDCLYCWCRTSRFWLLADVYFQNAVVHGPLLTLLCGWDPNPCERMRELEL